MAPPAPARTRARPAIQVTFCHVLRFLKLLCFLILFSWLEVRVS